MKERKYYQSIKNDAKNEADCPELNQTWERAYLALADAADYLDAMIARCTERKAEK